MGKCSPRWAVGETHHIVTGSRGLVSHIEDIGQSDASSCVDHESNRDEGLTIASCKGKGVSAKAHDTMGQIIGHWSVALNESGFSAISCPG